ncbi:VOC family protein [Fibrella arboris]|uniref:VOC family protein n=1 Tax=Fibrella arboris TaxID=3242486 RepID=UPI0035208D3E
MPQTIAQIALVVEDYDAAIRFYVDKLNFTLVEDTTLSDTKRWVRVAPPGQSPESPGCQLLLARAADDGQRSRIGNQTGGRVFLFLNTDDFWRDFQRLTQNGVQIVREPAVQPYGTVAVFADLYGNLWDLIGPTIPPTN